MMRNNFQTPDARHQIRARPRGYEVTGKGSIADYLYAPLFPALSIAQKGMP
jgi:hypothetical protein